MIDFNCPNCGHRIHVDELAAGKSGKCKGCGKKITVPSAPSAPLLPVPVNSRSKWLIVAGVAIAAVFIVLLMPWRWLIAKPTPPPAQAPVAEPDRNRDLYRPTSLAPDAYFKVLTDSQIVDTLNAGPGGLNFTFTRTTTYGGQREDFYESKKLPVELRIRFVRTGEVAELDVVVRMGDFLELATKNGRVDQTVAKEKIALLARPLHDVMQRISTEWGTYPETIQAILREVMAKEKDSYSFICPQAFAHVLMFDTSPPVEVHFGITASK